jgi:hypothetical protein
MGILLIYDLDYAFSEVIHDSYGETVENKL